MYSKPLENNKPTPSNTIKEKWVYILRNGPSEDAVSFTVDPLENGLPHWFDREKLQECHQVVREFRPYLRACPTIGIMMLLLQPVIMIPLLHSKKHECLSAMFSRYLDTAVTGVDWISTDLIDKESKPSKSIMKVNQKHKMITKMMRGIPLPEEVLKSRPGLKTVWISQYTMTITQFAFIGLFFLFPDKCGCHFSCQKERDKVFYSLNYLWRTIGFLLGMKDEYNLCQENIEETIELCDIVLNQVFLPAIKNQGNSIENNPGFSISCDIITVMKSFLPMPVSGHIIFNYWFKVFGLQELMLEMSLMDQIKLSLIEFSMKYISRIRKLMSISDNKMVKEMIRLDSNRGPTLKEWNKKCPEIKYSLEKYMKDCPEYTLNHFFPVNKES